MGSQPVAHGFDAPAQSYDGFMGRYARPLAPLFADFAGVTTGQRVVDVGCGPGALTAELADRLGACQVLACDPSPPFVSACRERLPGVDVRSGTAESIPFGDQVADLALAQLVLHFVTDPVAAGQEMARVVRPGGVVAACVWDFSQGMQMLRAFWDAALTVDPEAPDELQVLRFGREHELARWLTDTGLEAIAEAEVTVHVRYRDFAELWNGFLAGIGPAGSYCVGLADDHRAALRDALFERLGRPGGGFTLSGTARAARGTRR